MLGLLIINAGPLLSMILAPSLICTSSVFTAGRGEPELFTPIENLKFVQEGGGGRGSSLI